MRKLYIGQVFVLVVGTIFAWVTVVQDFSRFYSFEGTIFKLQNCVVPNPVTTPCFYGAFAFLIALIWSIRILRGASERRFPSEGRLRWLLVASTLFAWGNFGYVLYSVYAPNGSRTGCSGFAVTNPFTTPCFVGSAIFLIALIVSFFILSREARIETLRPTPEPPK